MKTLCLPYRKVGSVPALVCALALFAPSQSFAQDATAGATADTALAGDKAEPARPTTHPEEDPPVEVAAEPGQGPAPAPATRGSAESEATPPTRDFSSLSYATPPERGEVRVIIDVSPLRFQDPRVRTVGSGNDLLVQSRFGAGYRAPFGLTGHLSYVDATLVPAFGQTIRPSLRIQGVDASVRWDHEFLGRLRPYVALTGGAREHELSFRTPAGRLTANRWAPAFAGGAGLEFVIRFDHVAILLQNEHGYHWQPEVHFDSAQASTGEPVDVGSAQLHGYYFRFGVGLAFPF